MSGLSLWVVYEHPNDWPDYYVARRWSGDQPTRDVMIDRSLEELRRILSQGYGLVRIPRDDAWDDPVIVESWI